MERTYASGDAQVKSRKPKTGQVALGKASLGGTVRGCTVARLVRVLGQSGQIARIISAGKSSSIALSATREIGYPSVLKSRAAPTTRIRSGSPSSDCARSRSKARELCRTATLLRRSRKRKTRAEIRITMSSGELLRVLQPRTKRILSR